jgi:hypothetical protein
MSPDFWSHSNQRPVPLLYFSFNKQSIEFPLKLFGLCQNKKSADFVIEALGDVERRFDGPA